VIGGEQLRRSVAWIRDLVPGVAAGGFDLLVAATGMVIVGRTYWEAGLGVYSFALSCFVIGAYLFDGGLTRYTGHRIVRAESGTEGREAFLRGAKGIFVLGLLAFCLLSGFASYFALATAVRESPLLYPLLGIAIATHNYTTLRADALHSHGVTVFYDKNEKAVSHLTGDKVTCHGARQ